MVANFFAVDFQTLEKLERRVLEEVARAERLALAPLSRALGVSEEALAPSVFALATMGYLAPEADGYRIGNSFFHRWLSRARALAGGEAGQ
jgi:hypothetical protein